MQWQSTVVNVQLNVSSIHSCVGSSHTHPHVATLHGSTVDDELLLDAELLLLSLLELDSELLDEESLLELELDDSLLELDELLLLGLEELLDDGLEELLDEGLDELLDGDELLDDELEDGLLDELDDELLELDDDELLEELDDELELLELPQQHAIIAGSDIMQLHPQVRYLLVVE